MKKLVCGLLGIVLSCAGCQRVNLTNEEAVEIKNYSDKIKKIIGAEPNEYYAVYPVRNKGDLFQVLIGGKERIKSVTFYDLNGDGEYDSKYTIEIPTKLEVLGVFPDPNEPKLRDDFRKDIPQDSLPKKRAKNKLMVYN